MSSSPNRSAAASWLPYLTVIAAIGVALAASGAPSPTYPTLAAMWGLSAGALTLAYAAYGFGVIVALLTTGGVSDRVGRRPVIVTSLLLLTASMLLLAIAPNLPFLIIGRLVQGLATGVLTGAAGAALTELHPRANVAAAAATNSMTTSLAIAFGALLSGALLAAGDVVRVPFVVMAALSAAAAVGAAFTLPRPEATPQAALLRLQRLSVPSSVRREFLMGSLAVIAAWSVGGLYLALGGTLGQALLGLHGPLVSGTVILAVQGFGAVVQYCWTRLHPTASNELTISVAVVALTAGITLTGAAIVAGSAATAVAGSLLSGAGFGLAFLGGTRLISVAAPAQHRGEVVAAYFVVAYLAISVPAICVGFLIAAVGSTTAFIVFAALVIAVCVVVATMLAARVRAIGLRDEPTA